MPPRCRPRSPRRIRRRIPARSGISPARRIDQAYIGACVGAKLTDLHMVAEVLRGRRVARGTRLLVAPASQQVMSAAAADGTLETISAAGAYLLPTGCGACAALGAGILAEDEVCISSTNRNFQGPHGAEFLAGLPGLALHGGRSGRGRAHYRSAGAAGMSAIRVEGKAWVFGDNINTDAMAPGLYFKSPMSVMAQHCLESVDPAFAKEVQTGDIVVGGTNFGVGSAREQAAMALQYLGVGAVLAPSFGRIFYRNVAEFRHSHPDLSARPRRLPRAIVCASTRCPAASRT